MKFCFGVIVALTALTSSSTVGQQRYSTVSLIVQAAEYNGTFYTAPPLPRSTHVFIAGERIKFNILLANNRGDHPVRLTTASELAANFAVSSLHGIPLTVALTNDVRLRTAVGEARIDWTPDITLNAGELLIIRGEVTNVSLPPGEHAVTFSTTITDSQGLSLAPQATRFQIEVRAQSTESAPEEFRRSAARAIVARDYAVAEGWIDALVKVHPQSYLAFQMRGHIAELQGNRGRARAAYAQALALIQAKADRHRSSVDAVGFPQDVIDALTQRIRMLDAATVP